MNLNIAIPIAAAAMGTAVATFAALRAGRSLTRWALAITLLALAAESACNAWIVKHQGPTLPNLQALKIILAAIGLTSCLLFSLLYSRAPAPARLRNWILPLLGLLLLPLALALTQHHNLIHPAARVADTQHWLIPLRWPALLAHALRLLTAILILLNLERTHRASVGTMRWRIKYVILGIAAIVIVRIYTGSQVLIYNASDQRWWTLDSAALLLGTLLLLRGLLRSGVFGLEVYPSQTVIRHSLTFTLAGIYLLLLGLGAKAATLLGGDASFSLKAFIVLFGLVTLALILQSDHVRLRIRRLVSRHFQRPLYEYAAIWRNFSEGTASCVDQAQLTQALVRLFAQTFQTLSVNLWLIDEKAETVSLSASTAHTGTSSWNLIPTRREAIAIIRHFTHAKEPVDLDRATGDWAEALRRCNPVEFPNGGHRLCLALRSGGELLALVTLGDRVAGLPFSDQDLDMLKCAGNDAATSLLNVRLQQQTLLSREFEAFQTMAAFFVHDLKNSASTLTLMLQNLPEHYDDPAFRADALRGISKTVTHINNLVSRLNLLRQGFQLNPVPTELDPLLQRILADCGSKPGVTLATTLGAPPSLALDPEQIGKVITNLLLNAMEATEPGGKIDIATRTEGAWALLTVADTGCGMTKEFREQALFRPFQTTKKNGLGIGMFQSKMIVEAHRGTIAVHSEPGRGTTFTVRLPLTNNSLNPWAAPSKHR